MYHDVFQKTIEHEFSTGRYEGPFSQQQVEDILGPFQSSPISIVPKPNKPGKYRIIQNFSSPYTSNEGPRAINADIISSDFPCTWGTFETICTTILHLPPGSQAAVRDIAEAYRTILIKPTQWPGTVVRISQSQFAIDKCLAFGCSSSAGVYGNLADASADIFRAEGIGPISNSDSNIMRSSPATEAREETEADSGSEEPIGRTDHSKNSTTAASTPSKHCRLATRHPIWMPSSLTP
jgi:hypothetical protein